MQILLMFRLIELIWLQIPTKDYSKLFFVLNETLQIVALEINILFDSTSNLLHRRLGLTQTMEHKRR